MYCLVLIRKGFKKKNKIIWVYSQAAIGLKLYGNNVACGSDADAI